jgi:aspartyl protease family protein
MVRNVIFVIFAFGFFASMLTNCASRTGSRSNDRAFSERAVAVPPADSWSDAHPRGTTTTTSDGSVELQRESDGHFYADVQINGANIRALVDTGATEIALSRADAGSAGIATSIGMPEVVGEGADGAVHGEVVMIDRISLGPKTAETMPAVVLNQGGESLLGQSFLSKFDSVEIHGDTMVLK